MPQVPDVDKLHLEYANLIGFVSLCVKHGWVDVVPDGKGGVDYVLAERQVGAGAAETSC